MSTSTHKSNKRQASNLEVCASISNTQWWGSWTSRLPDSQHPGRGAMGMAQIPTTPVGDLGECLDARLQGINLGGGSLFLSLSLSLPCLSKHTGVMFGTAVR